MPVYAVVDIRETFGAAFIGLLVSSLLFGLTIVQTWIYFWNYRKRDSMGLNIFIAFVIVLDAAHTAVCAYAIYWYLVLNFGNIENLDYNVWALNLQVHISIVISGAVQSFYARRVYLLSQSIICPIIIVVSLAVSTSFGFLSTAKEMALKRFSMFGSLTWISSVGLTGGAVADLLIAGAMCWSLYHKKTGFARTDSIISTLMAYSIHSGVLTSVLGTATMITFVVSPSTMNWLPIFWALMKCYVNSLLAMLNSRDYVRDRSITDDQDNAFNLSSIRIEPQNAAYGSKSRPGVSVTVHRSTSTASDFAKSRNDYNGGLTTFEVPKPLKEIHSKS